MHFQLRSFSLLTVLLMISTSCSQFLEVTPLSVASEQAFYRTRQDAIVATNGCYNPLIEIYRGTSGGAIWLFTDVLSDDADDPDATIDNFAFDSNNGNVQAFWRLNYLGVARCNTLLGRIGGIGMEEDLKRRLQLEARYLRAFYYFNLVRFFGNVPLVLEEVRTIDASLPQQSTADAVYQQIVADLTAAEELPILYAPADAGRATRGAAKALLAKVHLTRRNWEQAAAKSREVIELNTYRLLPNYADVFTVTNRNSAESIFEVQFGRGAQVGTGNPVTSFFFQQFAPAGSGTLVTGIPGSNGEGRMVPTNDLLAAFEPGDPRRTASFRTFYTRQVGNRIDTVRINFTTKYLDPTATAGGGLASGQGSENNYRVLRYADVLLMHAEALNELGQTAPALEAINQVRRRARGTASGVLPDLSGLNQAALREAIWRERRTELALEGHRWFDLIRTGRALPILGPTRNMQPRNVLLPIPERERDLNRNLTQNPGY